MTKAAADQPISGPVARFHDGSRGEATRGRIRGEALELFYRQGFRATTMREITGASGLTPAAFYNHFASKDELLLDIVEDAFEGLNEAVTTATAAAEPSATAQLRALMRSMTLWHCDHMRQAKVANRETQELSEEMVATVRERLSGLRSIAEEIIDAGTLRGEFAPAATGSAATRTIATAIVGFPRSISTSALESMGTDGLAELFENLVLRMVGVPTGAQSPA